MKRIVFILICSVTSICGYSQFINSTSAGSATTLNFWKGGVSADSAMILSKQIFADTTAANFSVASKYSGALIQVTGGQIWYRTLIPAKWWLINSSAASLVSITQAYGIIATPNPITNTGTVGTDTSVIVSKPYFTNIAVKYWDTVNMLSNLLRKTDTANMLLPYVRKSDTANNGYVVTIGVTTGNGVSATSSGGKNPRLAVTLGDITPTSVNSSGVITATSAGTQSPAFVALVNGTNNAGVYQGGTNPLFNIKLGSDYNGVLINAGGNISSFSSVSNLFTTGNISTGNLTATTITGSLVSGLTFGYGMTSTATSYNNSIPLTEKVDTTLISTKANVTASILGKLNISDTSSMLSGYARTGNVPSQYWQDNGTYLLPLTSGRGVRTSGIIQSTDGTFYSQLGNGTVIAGVSGGNTTSMGSATHSFIQGSSQLNLKSRNLVTGSHDVYFQNKDYTAADSADIPTQYWKDSSSYLAPASGYGGRGINTTGIAVLGGITTTGDAHVGGNILGDRGLKLHYVSVSSTYSVTTTGDFFVDCSAGTFTVTLPNGAVTAPNFIYVIKNSGTGIITINAAGPGTIDGASSVTLSNQNSSYIFQSDALNGWKIIGSYVTAVAATGSVTNVSVVTANGVSGSVANPTTTPAITLTLGAITPSSVSSSGAITGTTLAGTLVTAAQPNITSVGTLTILTVSGSTTTSGIVNTGVITSTSGSIGTAAFVSVGSSANNGRYQMGSANVNYNIRGGSDNSGVIIQAGTAANTFNDDTHGSGLTTANVSASGTLTGTSLSGLITTVSQTNITSLGTQLNLTSSGVVNGNSFVNNSVSAFYAPPGNGFSRSYASTTAGHVMLGQGSTYDLLWIDHGGNLVIGATTGGAGAFSVFTLAGTGSRAVLADVNGVLSAPVSDRRVKKNIHPIEYGLKEILKMKPVSFNYIDSYKNYGTGIQYGQIAQDLEKIIPELVVTDNKKDPKTGITGVKGINYGTGQLDAVMIRAIQEMQIEIALLKKEVNNLKKKK